MEKWLTFLSGGLVAASLSCSCNLKSEATVDKSTNEPMEQLLLGNFNADSAYNFIARQVEFGPRVPNTPGHEACAKYLIGELERLGVDTMLVQKGKVKAYNGDVLNITNIIAGINHKALRRILLVAHWDTRPWADNDPDLTKRQQPIDGANDGASGVGVLLEIARNLCERKPNVGVDILFVDAEDYGSQKGFAGDPDSWCLGTQYFIEQNEPYNKNNRPVYGILLDMVGGKDARFHYEHFSKQNAPTPCLKIWSEAQRLGYDNIFINKLGGAITDDHIYLTDAGIPTCDIIETVNDQTGSFPPTWHTHDDNMSNISKSSLQAVGETVLNVVYKEKAY